MNVILAHYNFLRILLSNLSEELVPVEFQSIEHISNDLGRNRSELIAENALLRQQLIMLKRQVKRPTCRKADRMLLVLLARMLLTWEQALFIVQPETLLRWHREGFRMHWKHKSKADSSKPKLSAEIVTLIKDMIAKNRLWGAERIRGELLKLGIHVCKRTIQKYMMDKHRSICYVITITSLDPVSIVWLRRVALRSSKHPFMLHEPMRSASAS